MQALKTTFSCVLLFLFYVTTLCGKSNPTDSLRQLLSETTEAGGRAELLLQLSLTDIEKAAAIDFATQAIEAAEEAKLTDLSGNAYRQRSILHQRAGSYETAVEDSREALARFRIVNDTDRITTVLIDLGTLYQSLGDRQQAESWAQQALPLCRAQRDTAGIAAVLTNLAGIANNQGKTDLAVSYLDSVLILDSLQKSWGYFSQGLGNIALIQMRRGNLNKALDYALRGLSVSEDHDNLGGRYMNTTILGEVYIQLLDAEPAVRYSRQAVKYAGEMGQKRYLGQANRLLQQAFQVARQPDSVAQYFQLALALTDPGQLSIHFNNYGTYLRDDLRDTAAAVEFYQRALFITDSLEDQSLSFIPLVNLSVIAAAAGRWPKARAYLRRAEPSREGREVDLKPSVLTTMGRIYQQSGEMALAADYYGRALNLQQNLVANHDSTRSQVAAYERELTQLRERNQEESLAAAEQELRFRNRALAGGGVLIVLLAVATWLARRRGRRLKRALIELERMRAEVHHRVRNDFQSIASMFFVHLHELDDDKARLTLNGVYDRIRNLGQVHALLQEDHGAIGGLSTHLRTLAEKRLASLPSAIGVTLDFRDELSSNIGDRVNPLQVRQLAIIVNELITNAEKHAFVDHPAPVLRLCISGDQPGEALTVMVSDNGQGLTTSNAQQSSSFGLTMIQGICSALNWEFGTEASSEGNTYFITTNIRS